MPIRTIAAALILFIGIIFQIIIGETFGMWINFSLAALAATAFFLSFAELMILVLVTVFLLNWQPAPSFEILFFAGFPLAAFALRRVSHFQPWIFNLFLIFAGIVAMYAIFGPGVIFVKPILFFSDLFGSILFGVFTFRTLEAVKTS